MYEFTEGTCGDSWSCNKFYIYI